VPVTNLPVAFGVNSGGGQLKPLANTTDSYGIAAAEPVLGPNPGTNVYMATAGTLTASFQATGLLQPSILSNKVVNAANYASQPPAPGSYIAIFGNNLANTSLSYSTRSLPVSLNQVSVSFDSPNVSVPGHIVFISPGQITVQVPWELEGQPSVQLKVSVGDNSSEVYTLPLGTWSPAFFETQNLAAALDEANDIVTASNPVARGHIVQLFANGLGPVTNQPASGDPTTISPLSMTTTTPVVSIGGMNADVKFSGMSPGNAALYQVNAVVPDTAAGLQTVTISMGGVMGSTSHLPVK
jgi:minor extracellular serine protease Vpr